MRFPSGIAGVVVITLALMGSIGVGFLLNGASDYETVNDYDYITDVTGLYTYTPVAQYSNYSPAQNNYQYSETLADLGTYTSGIDYTPAGAANLNPVLTPSSGVNTTTGSLAYSDLTSTETSAKFLLGERPWKYPDPVIDGQKAPSPMRAAAVNYKVISVQDLADIVGDYSTISFSLPTSTVTYVPAVSGTTTNASISVQKVGIFWHTDDTLGTAAYTSGRLIEAGATVGEGQGFSDNESYTLANNNYSFTWEGDTYSFVNPIGVVSDLTLNANGTVSYTYTANGQPTAKVVDASECYLCFLSFVPNASGDSWTNIGGETTLSYTVTYYENVNYLDPNGGVSASGSEVYWSNGNENGEVIWTFQKPSAASKYEFSGMTSGNAEATNWTVEYGSQWIVTYTDPSGNLKTLRLGNSWPAIQIADWYTGQIQVTPIKSFTNFTNFTLGATKTYATVEGGNSPISYYHIEKTSGTMKFACVGTSVKTGNVPGAMYDATFNAASYFPDYENVRIAFDSAAFVGSSVSVSTWTMIVDSASFSGSFELGGRTYEVDLTKPWAITWEEGSDSVVLSFVPVKRTSTTSVEILNAANIAPAVNLGGQWVIDTDLYEVGSHIEEVYDWNFGNWGLDSKTFIVAALGLTALIAIGFKLARVPMGILDMIIIFGGCAIMWVVM